MSEPGDDSEHYVNICCYPDRAASKEGRTEGVIVMVTDTTRLASHRRVLEQENERNRENIERLNRHAAELTERQRALMQANAELSSANVDLRNANEHLMISAEEAEASAEEVETLNEEMQATSEELETLNEELHATVEELNTTNEELGARTSDLERAAKDRQQQLDNAVGTLATLRAVVDHVPLVMCIVDRHGLVSLASRRYVELAERNAETMPGVGDRWQAKSGEVTLSFNGTSQRYVIETVPLPENGGAVMQRFDPAP